MRQGRCMICPHYNWLVEYAIKWWRKINVGCHLRGRHRTIEHEDRDISVEEFTISISTFGVCLQSPDAHASTVRCDWEMTINWKIRPPRGNHMMMPRPPRSFKASGPRCFPCSPPLTYLAISRLTISKSKATCEISTIKFWGRSDLYNLFDKS